MKKMELSQNELKQCKDKNNLEQVQLIALSVADVG
jgi:hypothetical protein